jgi:hypothetical protein
MAWKYLTASAAVGSTGDYNLAKCITINGTDPGATDPGTVTIKTGGASGTTQVEFKIPFGATDQIFLPNITFDYITLVDAKCMVEYYKQHGKA